MFKSFKTSSVNFPKKAFDKVMSGVDDVWKSVDKVLESVDEMDIDSGSSVICTDDVRITVKDGKITILGEFKSLKINGKVVRLPDAAK